MSELGQPSSLFYLQKAVDMLLKYVIINLQIKWITFDYQLRGDLL